MHFGYMHPCDQIVMLMARVYQYGMTTTSGGNLSVIDEKGDIWISPAAVDKGSLKAEDVVRVRANGEVNGRHAPSSEYPFHKAIYESRPGIGAILHAHPSALVAFSVVGKVPDTTILPHTDHICGTAGFAPYAIPGSEALGKHIADTFEKGYDSVVLENHGVVCAGDNLLDAYHRFETLDFCARVLLKSALLGAHRTLSAEQIAMFHHRDNQLPEFKPEQRTNKEKKLRKFIRDIVHRAYDQHIMTSTEGVLSARLDDNSFLITPTGMDRKYIDEADIVLIRGGRREEGRLPSLSVLLHQAIYHKHPDMKSIILARVPNAMAFGVTEGVLDTRTIPESYVALRSVKKLPYGSQFGGGSRVADAVSESCPVVLLENDSILATGGSILQAFDRIEVAEFTARSLINALSIGKLAPINDAQLRELEDAFDLKKSQQISVNHPAPRPQSPTGFERCGLSTLRPCPRPTGYELDALTIIRPRTRIAPYRTG